MLHLKYWRCPVEVFSTSSRAVSGFLFCLSREMHTGLHFQVGDVINSPASSYTLVHWPTGGNNVSRYAGTHQQRLKTGRLPLLYKCFVSVEMCLVSLSDHNYTLDLVLVRDNEYLLSWILDFWSQNHVRERGWSWGDYPYWTRLRTWRHAVAVTP